jgi:hypothetical protein
VRPTGLRPGRGSSNPIPSRGDPQCSTGGCGLTARRPNFTAPSTSSWPTPCPKAAPHAAGPAGPPTPTGSRDPERRPGGDARESSCCMAETHATSTGNLTDDPELKFTPNGVAVANLRIAVHPPGARRGGLEGTGRPRSFASTSGATRPSTSRTRSARATAPWSSVGSRPAPGRPPRRQAHRLQPTRERDAQGPSQRCPAPLRCWRGALLW